MLALKGTLRFFVPPLGFAVAALVIGYGFVVPNRGTAGVSGATIGCGFAVLGACIAYILGLWAVVSDRGSSAAV